MTIINQLLYAEFEGVSFLCPSDSVDRGKKVVYHEYPNSDVRYIEELGKLPPTFNLTAIIHGPDAINRRFLLEGKLEKEGRGLLVHPIYGRINVVATTFSISSNQTDIGKFVFQIVFSQSRENITPLPQTPTAAEVSSRAELAREKINDALENTYKPPSTVSNFVAAKNTAENIFRAVKGSVDTVADKTAEGAANFSRQYRNVTNNISSIVSSAQEIRQNITTFYAAMLDAPVFVEQLIDAFDNLLEYPLTVATTSTLTNNQFERQQNDIALIEHMKINALIGSYESKSHKDFVTDDNLTIARQALDDYFKELFTQTNNDIERIGFTSIANDPEVIAAISDLRTTARQVFDDKEKVVFRIVDISPGKTSIALATYRYYGNLELIQQMVDLNPNINCANFNSTIKALSQ